MAQSRAITPVDIYNELSSNTTFMGYVGNYTFLDNSTDKALSVITPSKVLPNVASVSGLEVLIHDNGIPSRRDYVTNISDILMTYQIFVMVWEPANGEDLNLATAEIMRTFSGSRLIRTVPQTLNENILVQNLIEIPNNAAIMV